MTLPRLLALVVLVDVLAGGLTAAGARDRQPLPEVLRAAAAQYATLAAYSDTGTIRTEVPGLVDESRFTTRFRRATGDLYFEYQGLTSTNPRTRFTVDMRGQRTVLWMAGNEMQKYDYASRTHQLIPPGNGQVRALHGLAHPTHGTSVLVVSLLYPKAQLPGAILQLESASLMGVETVGARRCHKVTGIAAARHPSGQRRGVRPVTVWIDVESRLVRQVFEDTPQSYAPGAHLRTTIAIEPRANPTFADDAFRFTPPS